MLALENLCKDLSKIIREIKRYLAKSGIANGGDLAAKFVSWLICLVSIRLIGFKSSLKCAENIFFAVNFIIIFTGKSCSNAYQLENVTVANVTTGVTCSTISPVNMTVCAGACNTRTIYNT